MSLCVFCKGSFLIAFCRILCYSTITAQPQQALCCKMQVVKLSPGVKSGGVQFFVILRTVRMFLHQRPKGGVHYGSVLHPVPFSYREKVRVFLVKCCSTLSQNIYIKRSNPLYSACPSQRGTIAHEDRQQHFQHSDCKSLGPFPFYQTKLPCPKCRAWQLLFNLYTEFVGNPWFE